jgi:hypothetical protein
VVPYILVFFSAILTLFLPWLSSAAWHRQLTRLHGLLQLWAVMALTADRIEMGGKSSLGGGALAILFPMTVAAATQASLGLLLGMEPLSSAVLPVYGVPVIIFRCSSTKDTTTYAVMAAVAAYGLVLRVGVWAAGARLASWWAAQRPPPRRGGVVVVAEEEEDGACRCNGRRRRMMGSLLGSIGGPAAVVVVAGGMACMHIQGVSLDALRVAVQQHPEHHDLLLLLAVAPLVWATVVPRQEGLPRRLERALGCPEQIATPDQVQIAAELDFGLQLRAPLGGGAATASSSEGGARSNRAKRALQLGLLSRVALLALVLLVVAEHFDQHAVQRPQVARLLLGLVGLGWAAAAATDKVRRRVLRGLVPTASLALLLLLKALDGDGLRRDREDFREHPRLFTAVACSAMALDAWVDAAYGGLRFTEAAVRVVASWALLLGAAASQGRGGVPGFWWCAAVAVWPAVLVAAHLVVARKEYQRKVWAVNRARNADMLTAWTKG